MDNTIDARGADKFAARLRFVGKSIPIPPSNVVATRFGRLR